MRTPLLYLAFVLLFASPALGTGPGEGIKKPAAQISWIGIEEAEKLCTTAPRQIFVDVYTDWCGWCKKMDISTFKDPAVVDYVNANYYAVKLDAESSKQIIFRGKKMTEAELAGAVFKVNGYPTIVLIEQDFSNYIPVSGFQDAEDFEYTLTEFNRKKRNKTK